MAIRNIAIIAHVDHGKTTLVDQMFGQAGIFRENQAVEERVMDSNPLEKERGITILAKNTAVQWNDVKINIVDTPGHADFGGEVERVLSMVDSVLLLVDAVEGPMPQTAFVTRKALEAGLKPVVVVNKVDRVGARPDWAVDQTFDLFDRLGATEEQLDFTTVFASAIEGWASASSDERGEDMDILFQTIVDQVAPPAVDRDGPFRMQVSALDYSSYVGVIGIGRIERGRISRNAPVSIIGADGARRQGRMLQILGFHGLERGGVSFLLKPIKSAFTELGKRHLVAKAFLSTHMIERHVRRHAGQPVFKRCFQRVEFLQLPPSFDKDVLRHVLHTTAVTLVA